MSNNSDILAGFPGITVTDENARYARHLLGLSLHDFHELVTTDSLEKRGGEYARMRVILGQNYTKYYLRRIFFNRYFDIISDIHSPILSEIRTIVHDGRKPFYMSRHNMRRLMLYASKASLQNQIVGMNSYSMLYHVDGEKKTRYAFIYGKKDRIIPDMSSGYAACVGGGMLSLDGEYRPIFVDEVHVNDAIRINDLIFQDILKASINVKLEPVSFPPLALTKQWIEDRRVDINLYMVSIFMRYMEHKLSLRDPALVDADSRELLGETIDMMDRIFDHHGANAMVTIYEQITLSGQVVVPPNIVGKGQKLVPLSVPEGRSTMNIMLKSWREIYIHNELVSLFLNFVAHAFPLIYNWYILDDIDDRMFGKYDSEHYAAILGDSIATDSKVTTGNRRRFLDASKRTSMSGLLILLEHVGDPVKSMVYMHKSEYYMQHGPFLFAKYENIEVYLFTLMYTLLAMNTRLGLIHCDLHLNNVTIAQTTPEYRDRANLYHIYGDLYAPPVTNLDTYIIDFSRSLITPKLETVNFEAYNAETMRFYYRKLFPDEQMEAQIERNHAAMYNQFAAIDMYMHTTRLAAYMREYKRDMKIPDPAMKLVEAIRADTVEMLTIEARAVSATAEPPNKRLIERHFAHLRVGADDVKKIKNIGIVYSIHNEIRFPASDVSTYITQFGFMKDFDDDMELALISDFVTIVDASAINIITEASIRNKPKTS